MHDNGDLTLYGTAVLAKNANGEVEIKQAVDDGPVGTATGLMVGALLGVLAGPATVASGAAVAGSAAKISAIYSATCSATSSVAVAGVAAEVPSAGQTCATHWIFLWRTR